MSGDFGLWGSTAGPPISDQVWPPSGTPFVSFAGLRPQPTAEPEQPAAPRTSVARPLTRNRAQMECSPTIFLTSQPPHCHGLPSAFPSRRQARPHPPRRHPCGARATPHTSCPGLVCPALTFTSSGLPPAPQTHPDPAPTPTSRRSVPASHLRLARLRHRAHASAEGLLKWPADLWARFPRAPHAPSRRPSRQTPPKHPRACLPAPRLAAAPSACDRAAQVPDPRGAPTSQGPKHLRPILSPTHADAHDTAGASRRPPLTTTSTRRDTGALFPKGTRLRAFRTQMCRPLRTLVTFVGRPLHLRRTQSLNRREMKPFGDRRARDWPRGRLWWAITLGESS